MRWLRAGPGAELALGNAMGTTRGPRTRQGTGDDVLERRRVLEAEAVGAGAIIERHVAPSHRYALVIYDAHPAGGIAYAANVGEHKALDVARLLVKLIAREAREAG